MATVASTLTVLQDNNTHPWHQRMSEADQLDEYDFDNSFDNSTLNTSTSTVRDTDHQTSPSVLACEVTVEPAAAAKVYDDKTVISKPPDGGGGVKCSSAVIDTSRSSPSSGFNSGSFEDHQQHSLGDYSSSTPLGLYTYTTTVTHNSKQKLPHPPNYEVIDQTHQRFTGNSSVSNARAVDDRACAEYSKESSNCYSDVSVTGSRTYPRSIRHSRGAPQDYSTIFYDYGYASIESQAADYSQPHQPTSNRKDEQPLLRSKVKDLLSDNQLKYSSSSRPSFSTGSVVDSEDTEGYEYIETVNPSVIYNITPINNKKTYCKEDVQTSPPQFTSESAYRLVDELARDLLQKEYFNAAASIEHSSKIAAAKKRQGAITGPEDAAAIGSSEAWGAATTNTPEGSTAHHLLSTVNFPGDPSAHDGWDNESEYWKLECERQGAATARVVGRREGRLRKKERERRKTRCGEREAVGSSGLLSVETNIKESKSESELRDIESLNKLESSSSKSRGGKEDSAGAKRKRRARGRSEEQERRKPLDQHHHDSRPQLCSSCGHPIASCKCAGVMADARGRPPPHAATPKRAGHRQQLTAPPPSHDRMTTSKHPPTSLDSTTSAAVTPRKSSSVSSSSSPSKAHHHHHVPHHHHHHQPPMLKTVSIMDTLSELAGVNDVKKLSQVPAPPVLSSQFRQYTKKVYDAVTARDSDITSQTEQTLGERGQRTPEWIKRIFDVARKGDIQTLKRITSDMEGALLRNLSDATGNNLVHVSACLGHVSVLAWLITTLPAINDALYDENKFGQTPTICSIKYGQLEVLQWLVSNTSIRDKVRCKEGERSLLHLAAKYAQEEILSWLVTHMMNLEVTLDNKDHHGNTALHLAARTGNSRVCSLLLQHGADLTIKNDLGQKAWEVCVVRGHMACAEYLCVHEAGLALATDLTRKEAELEAATSDNQDLRISFKEVMSVARRLLKEREEVMRELSRLNEHMMETHHSVLLSMQGIAEQQQQQHNSAGTNSSESVETAVRNITSLQERWQAAQKTWFSSSLVDLKHRMLLVEEAWKKLRHRSHRTVATTHHPLDVFRGKVLNVRSQGGEGHLGDLPSLCSSEESIAGLFPFDNDDTNLYEGISLSDQHKATEPPYQSVHSSSTPIRRGDLNLHQDLSPFAASAAPTAAEILTARTDASPTNISASSNLNNKQFLSNYFSPNTSNINKSVSVSRSNSKGRVIDFIGGGSSHHLSAEHHHIASVLSSPPAQRSTGITHEELLDLASPLYNSGGATRQPKLSKEEIAAKLKNLALTSESGSCSVLEVIDPSSDESDGDTFEIDEDILRDLETSKVLQEEMIRPKVGPERRAKRLSKTRYDHGLGGLSGRSPAGPDNNEGTTSSDSGGVEGSKDFIQDVRAAHHGDSSDLSNGSHFLSKKHQYSKAVSKQSNISNAGHFLASEASVEAVVADASNICNQRQQNIQTSPDEQEVTMKRKGFLHKFSIKPKWPSNKRKLIKPPSRKEERNNDTSSGSASYTLMGVSDALENRSELYNERSVDAFDAVDKNVSDKLESDADKVDRVKKIEKLERVDKHLTNLDSSPTETDIQSTPEISTSSSQEYSHNNSSSNNSSEESSIGKPVSSSPRIADQSSAAMQKPLKSSHVSSQRAQLSSNSETKGGVIDKSPTPPPIPPTRRPPPPPTTNLDNLPPITSRLSKEHISLRLSKEVLLEEDNEESIPQTSELEIRPESSASKFESMSRPGSSTSSFPTFKNELLQKSNLSLTHDLLPATDSSTGGRMSPAPSEVSKTESALSPPSHASDVSKSESTRQLSVSKSSSLSSATNCSGHSSQSNSTHSSLHSKDNIAIIDDACLRNQDILPPPAEGSVHLSMMAIKNKSASTSLKTVVTEDNKRTTDTFLEESNTPNQMPDSKLTQQSRHPLASDKLSKHPDESAQQQETTEAKEDRDEDVLYRSGDEASAGTKDTKTDKGDHKNKLAKAAKSERPWYELSDEEYDILLPDTMNSIGKLTRRTSSSEDESAIC